MWGAGNVGVAMKRSALSLGVGGELVLDLPGVQLVFLETTLLRIFLRVLGAWAKARVNLRNVR